MVTAEHGRLYVLITRHHPAHRMRTGSPVGKLPGGPWRWLQRQTLDWAQLSTGQQERLSRLGVQPLETPPPPPAAARGAKSDTRSRRDRFSAEQLDALAELDMEWAA